MAENFDNNVIISKDYIHYNNDFSEILPSLLGDTFLKFVSTSNELRLITKLLDIDIVAVSKIPYSKRSKYHIPHEDKSYDTLMMSTALHNINNPHRRCTMSLHNDGSHTLEIPIFVNDECIAYIMAGNFNTSSNEDNVNHDVATLTMKQVIKLCTELCQQGQIIISACHKYLRKDHSVLPVDFSMIFDAGCNFEYNLATDNYILSPKAAELLGWEYGKRLTYSDILNLVIEEERLATAKIMKEKVYFGNDSFTINVNIRRKNDNKLVNLEINGIVVKDKEGINYRSFGTFTDITKLKRVQEKLQTEIESKKRLVKVISHDLKNPFNGLIGFSDLLNTNLEQGNYDEAMDIAAIIKQSASEGYDFLINVLDYSNSQAEGIKVIRKDFDLYKTVDSILKLSATQAYKKGISLMSNISEDFVIFSDETKIATVLRNLISNAIKFCFNDGIVIIDAVYDLDSKLKISVSDTGIVMPKEKMDRINRGKSVNSEIGTAQEKGTNIGLSLCHSYLNALGTRLQVSCEDSITTFSFFLNAR